MRDSSGRPSDLFSRVSLMRPPMTIVWPLCTVT